MKTYTISEELLKEVILRISTLEYYVGEYGENEGLEEDLTVEDCQELQERLTNLKLV